MRISLIKILVISVAVGATLFFVFWGSNIFNRAEPPAPAPSNQGEPAIPTPPAPPAEEPPAPAPVSPPAQSPAEPPPPAEKPPTSKQPPPPGEPAPTEREPQEFIIKIYGYDKAEPPSLTIHVGDTVTLINLDNNLHWPGADPHPTHSSLPLFDALGGISKGQSYSYTFRQTGKYGWHDHILDDPPTIGHITVLP